MAAEPFNNNKGPIRAVSRGPFARTSKLAPDAMCMHRVGHVTCPAIESTGSTCGQETDSTRGLQLLRTAETYARVCQTCAGLSSAMPVFSHPVRQRIGQSAFRSRESGKRVSLAGPRKMKPSVPSNNMWPYSTETVPQSSIKHKDFVFIMHAVGSAALRYVLHSGFCFLFLCSCG